MKHKSVFRFDPDVDQEEVAEAALYAQTAVQAGVQLTLQDWLSLSPADRVAWAAAKLEHDVKWALDKAHLNYDPEMGKAKLLSRVDGGEGYKELKLRRLAQRVSERTVRRRRGSTEG